jgi:hypothetical protein
MSDLAQFCRRYPERFTELEGSWDEPSECIQGLSLTGEPSASANWVEISPLLMDAFREQLAKTWYQITQIEGLEREILLLKRRCDNLERTSPVIVLIESFAPEPYEIIKPFHAVIKFQEDQYIASFFDANLSTSGDTQEESIGNLKDIILGTFEILMTMDEKKLGPGPLRQRGLLAEFIRKKS